MISCVSQNGSANSNWRGGFASSCTGCGAQVWVKPSRAKRKQHFCSRECSNKWMSKIVGPLASNWRGGQLTRSCVQCGKAFTASKGEASRRPAIHCSRLCGAKSRKKRTSKECEVCQTVFEPRNPLASFCSRLCKARSQVKERSEQWAIMKRLNARVGSLMWYSLKGMKAGLSWQSLVGYTLADLLDHLESQFQAGMTWENMGEWHIDHIIPRKCFSFSAISDAGFRECWSLSNLQPLWAIDNLRKGSKLGTGV